MAMKRFRIGFTCALLSLTGCAAMQPSVSAITPPASQYDAVVVDPATGAPMTVTTLAERLANMDVVVVGEYHGHHAAHLLEARLQQALYRQHPNQVLTMEQFNVDHQRDLDRYLNDQSGESEMIEDAAAWDNYRASYRPLVEFARQHDIPVVAANAPATIVRCVGRQGPGYLDSLPSAQRQTLPTDPFLDTPDYLDKFVEAIGGSHGTEKASLSDRMMNTYRAQLLRDNTMAASILGALRSHPGAQILHTTGTFHSEDRLGTVALLHQRAPSLDIAVITPVFWPPGSETPPIAEHRNAGDYLYFIQPLPEEYKDPEREREAMRARFGKSPTSDCD
ncbi:MAG: ChaN family lipoprotein [Marinobacter sp.]|nr:ChaN family lipoprotein [Marinobacter sp.]